MDNPINVETIIREWIVTICHDLSIRVPSFEVMEIVPTGYYEGMDFCAGGFFGSNSYHVIVCSRISSAAQVVEILAHECRHAWQMTNSVPYPITLEQDADDYAKTFLKRFWERYVLWKDKYEQRQENEKQKDKIRQELEEQRREREKQEDEKRKEKERQEDKVRQEIEEQRREKQNKRGVWLEKEKKEKDHDTFPFTSVFTQFIKGALEEKEMEPVVETLVVASEPVVEAAPEFIAEHTEEQENEIFTNQVTEDSSSIVVKEKKRHFAKRTFTETQAMLCSFGIVFVMILVWLAMANSWYNG